jgi:serine/threonine protein kinase
VNYFTNQSRERLHRAGVIHGDAKPANLRIGWLRAVLVDFGVAAAPRGGHPGAALHIGPNPYAPMELCYEDPELRGPWAEAHVLQLTSPAVLCPLTKRGV